MFLFFEIVSMKNKILLVALLAIPTILASCSSGSCAISAEQYTFDCTKFYDFAVTSEYLKTAYQN